MTLAPLDIRLIGAALYGPQWQTPMATALGVSVRTVQRWAAGAVKVSPAMWAKILKIAERRQAEVGAALDRLQIVTRS
ncbi:hypothetical protein UFOVP16_9 [uncultured Caudovirales phage]|uniref:Uncharacterized protein n=1 Tax=uncultured Caudovirales phage TaxID=2100421 RepID=A0A6J5KJL7_9CAUD|nr:hypothetical protein UFOVP16_9 [uncultured Caudovirales phage]